MKKGWMFLIGIGAAVAYVIVSCAITGACHLSLAFGIGAVVMLALSGFRSPLGKMRRRAVRPQRPNETASTPPADGGKGGAPSAPKPTQNEVAPRDDRGAEKARALPREQPPEPREAPPEPDEYPPESDEYPPEPGEYPPEPFGYSPNPFGGSTSPFEDFPEPPPPFVSDGSDADEPPEELWERACAMEPDLDPELPVEDCVNYMELLFGAAEGGCVPALARLGEMAFVRDDFVEAYFWTKIAHRRLELSDDPNPLGLKEIDDMLNNIRRSWTAAGCPLEYENAYENFPEERGELGRALLLLDSRKEIGPSLEYIHFLADQGNPDAQLFAVR